MIVYLSLNKLFVSLPWPSSAPALDVSIGTVALPQRSIDVMHLGMRSRNLIHFN